MTSTTSYVKGRGEGWGDRQAVVGPSGRHGTHRRSARVMVRVGLHWSRVVVGAARHLQRVLLGTWGHSSMSSTVVGAHRRSSMVAVGPRQWWCWVLIAIHRWWWWALVDGGGCSSPFVEGGVEAHCGLGRMLLPSSPFVEGCVGHWSLFVEGDCGCWLRVVVDAGVSSSWVVVVVVTLWCSRGLVLCFVVVSDQLLHSRLPLSRIAWSSIMVIGFRSLVCYQLDDDERRHWSLFIIVQLRRRHQQHGT